MWDLLYDMHATPTLIPSDLSRLRIIHYNLLHFTLLRLISQSTSHLTLFHSITPHHQTSLHLTLAISRGMIDMASGIEDTMAAIALVRAVPLFSDTPEGE